VTGFDSGPKTIGLRNARQPRAVDGQSRCAGAPQLPGCGCYRNLGIASDPAVTVEFWMDQRKRSRSRCRSASMNTILVVQDRQTNGHEFIGFKHPGKATCTGVQGSAKISRASGTTLPRSSTNGNIDGSQLYIDGRADDASLILLETSNQRLFAVLNDSAAYRRPGRQHAIFRSTARWTTSPSGMVCGPPVRLAADMNGVNSQ